MDPLSDVLSLLKLRTYSAYEFDAGGAWSISFGQHEGIKCFAAVSGECWMQVEGVAAPVHSKPGDCLMLPRGRAFRVASDLQLPPTSGIAYQHDGVMRINGGGDVSSIGAYFELDADYAYILRTILPPVVLIRGEADRASLRWCIERMRQELRDRQPGGTLIAQQLAMMLLVQSLRLHLGETKGGVGWLFALSNKQMAAAIGAMHDDPGRRWTLQSLAQCAGMSRTSFALRFKEIVGVAPMEYLTRWRMLLAGERLVTSGDPISVLAPSLGYESESAFSTAFKRIMGCSPRQYARP